MGTKEKQRIRKRLHQRPPILKIRKKHFFYMLVSLILLLILYPFFSGAGAYGTVMLAILVTLIPIAGIYEASYDRRHFAIVSFLGVLLILSIWMNVVFPGSVFFYIDNVLAVVFYLYVIYIILGYILREKHITSNVLYGAISTYLLIGVMWSSLYNILHNISPGSFLNATGFTDFLYYSFVTLTTLGYGDITPVTTHAQSLAILEAISGVIFIAVIIAHLIGLYIVQETRR